MVITRATTNQDRQNLASIALVPEPVADPPQFRDSTARDRQRQAAPTTTKARAGREDGARRTNDCTLLRWDQSGLTFPPLLT